MVVVLLYRWEFQLAFPSTGHTLVGTALGLLLLFRTNASYDRLWEGRECKPAVDRGILRGMTRRIYLATLCLALLAAPVAAGPGLLGVSYPDVNGFAGAPAHLDRLKTEGFRLVCFVPSWAYVGLDRIDLPTGPAPDRFADAIAAALDRGFEVVLKPHLDPPIYKGLDLLASDQHSWRAACPWRGWFDVDPMAKDYREGVIGATLDAAGRALARRPAGAAWPSVRLDLGSELMDSLVHKPERWEQLLRHARGELKRRRLVGRVRLSHNVSHHFMIPEDEVLRMGPDARRALARYIAGLDAFAVSQYMDLTAAMPVGERGKRLPSEHEVAAALLAHERTLREEILGWLLGLRGARVPELHLGEFGIGRGGLRHPNQWQGDATAEQEAALAREIASGMRGLGAYLRGGAPRTARTAILWVTGRHFDVFGWFDARNAIPVAADAVRGMLRDGGTSERK